MRYLPLALLLSLTAVHAAEFRSNFSAQDRTWIGPEYWANPLQDWRLAGGRIEAAVGGGNRNVYLLTRELGGGVAPFEIRVRLGELSAGGPGWAGFRIGIKGVIDDYRYAALRGRGLNIGVTTSGKPFIGDEQARAAMLRRDAGVRLEDVELRLRGEPNVVSYLLTLSIHDPETGQELRRTQKEEIAGAELEGSLALVNEPLFDGGPSDQNSYGQQNKRTGEVRFWFDDWTLEGEKVVAREERGWGPILWAQHTLSGGVMKMTAQMPPLGVDDSAEVGLEIEDASGGWKRIGSEFIHTLSRTATFRVPDWEATRDVKYRLLYELDGEGHSWAGTVRADPVDQREIVVAAFTGNKDTGFPNTSVVGNVAVHDPDVLFFSGDQIYEDVAGFGIERQPVETAALDYLRKWYLLGWAFGDLMRDRVTVHMPDDHDVYQGNIWGGGGRRQPLSEHQRGGYVMPAEWLNAVQRTQASHLPDPYDSRPIEQGITVYYSELNYGRVSFAIVEDRKFKSGPKGITPSTGGRPDHITDPNVDARSYDAPGAKLLGDRQLRFIDDWASDWRNADFKVSLTQSIFANAATTHGANMMRLVADLDSNGWPQAGRNRALAALRKGFTFMIGGDQHLPSILHHGVEEFGDSGYSFCVPSIAAGYPRAYQPDEPAVRRPKGAPPYAGDRVDGLGNRMTVYAVANPVDSSIQRSSPLEKLHDKSSGYGIVRFDKQTRKISMECWKLLFDAASPSADDQFDGWPLTIDQTANYGRRAAGYLPLLEVSGLENPVVQVIDEESGETVYTLRILGTRFEPKVFEAWKRYTVRIGDPDRGLWRRLDGLAAGPAGEQPAISIEF